MSESELTIEVVLLHYGAKTVPGGHGWKTMKCPFHDDRTASASVNTTLNGFRCHGCEMSGDPIKVIQWAEAKTEIDEYGNEKQLPISFREAVEFAREKLEASMDEDRSSRSPRNQKKRQSMGRNRWREILLTALRETRIWLNQVNDGVHFMGARTLCQNFMPLRIGLAHVKRHKW